MKLFSALVLPIGLIWSRSINLLGNPEMEDLLTNTIDTIGSNILTGLDIHHPFSVMESIYISAKQYSNTGRFDFQIENLLKVKFYNGMEYPEPVPKIDFGFETYNSRVPNFGQRVSYWTGSVSKTRKFSAKQGKSDSYKYIHKTNLQMMLMQMYLKSIGYYDEATFFSDILRLSDELENPKILGKVGYVLNVYDQPSKANKYFTFESLLTNTIEKVPVKTWDRDGFNSGLDVDSKLYDMIAQFILDTYADVESIDPKALRIGSYAGKEDIHSQTIHNATEAFRKQVSEYLDSHAFYDYVETFSFGIALKNDRHGSKSIARIGDAANFNKNFKQHMSKLPLTMKYKFGYENDYDQDYSRLLRVGLERENKERSKRSVLDDYGYYYSDFNATNVDSNYPGGLEHDNSYYNPYYNLYKPLPNPSPIGDLPSLPDLTNSTTNHIETTEALKIQALVLPELNFEEFLPILEATGLDPTYIGNQFVSKAKLDIEIASARYAERINDFSCQFNAMSYIHPTSLQDTCILNLIFNLQHSYDTFGSNRSSFKAMSELRFKKGLLNYNSADDSQELFKLTFKVDKKPRYALAFYNKFDDQAISTSLLDSNFYQLNFENYTNGTKRELPLVIIPTLADVQDFGLQWRNKFLTMANSLVTYLYNPQTLWHLDAILQYFDDHGLFDLSFLDDWTHIGLAYPRCNQDEIARLQGRNDFIDRVEKGYIPWVFSGDYDDDLEYYFGFKNVYSSQTYSWFQIMAISCEIDYFDNWVPAGLYEIDSNGLHEVRNENYFRMITEGISEKVNELVAEIETLRTQITQYIDFSEALVNSFRLGSDEDLSLQTQPFKLQISQNYTVPEENQGITVTLPAFNLNNLKYFIHNHRDFFNNFEFFDWFYGLVDELNSSRVQYRNLHTQCMSDYDQCMEDMVEKIRIAGETIWLIIRDVTGTFYRFIFT